jgi:hypothetical protein
MIEIKECHSSQMYKIHYNYWILSQFMIEKDSHRKYKSRKTNNDVSTRTRSKVDYTDQYIGSRTWSKMHNVIHLSV